MWKRPGPKTNSTATAPCTGLTRTFEYSFHANNSPNPHGVSFNYWGYHFATDGTGGRAYQVRPDGRGGFRMQAVLNKTVRPVPANGVISSPHFPDKYQGNFLILNSIGFLGIKQYKMVHSTQGKDSDGDGFSDEYETVKKSDPNDANKKPGGSPGDIWGVDQEDLLLSPKDRNFRPTDFEIGSDGAMYVSDWQNIIIGHMQHNVRDPSRDHEFGRVYRITHEGRPLMPHIKVDGQPIAKLLDLLTDRTNLTRYRARIELSERKTADVMAALGKWLQQWNPQNPDHAHHLLEGLWLHQQHNVKNLELLEGMLKSPVNDARVAARTVKQFWDTSAAANVKPEPEKPHITQKKSGILSDTPELTTVRIGTLVEQMKYDTPKLTVKAGKKIKLTFANPDFLPHNIVLVKPGKLEAVAQAAVALGAEGFKTGFVPKTDDVIWASKLIDHGKEQVIQFTAPAKPGDYPYVCTFPGHHILMRGVLTVK